MNHDRLRLDLAELADEVTPVDLRERALRTSRRLGIQRAVATSAAAVVLLAAAAGTALAVRPEGKAPAPAPAGPSVTVTEPPVEVTPAPEPSAPATIEPTSQPSTSPAQPPYALAGTRYYLELTGSDARIHAVRPGEHRVYVLPLGNGNCVANSMTVSPDGKRLAWVKGAGADGLGTLVTSAIDGTRQRTLATGVTCLGSRPLVWQGGNYLMVQQGVRSVLMDMVAGKPHQGDPGQETDRAWSADGKCLAAVAGDGGKPYVGGCEVSRNYHYEPPKDEAVKYDGWQARSVSMDGRYVSIGWKGTDPSRRDDSFTVVDAATSKVVTLPVSGEVKSIQFAADGKVLVRQATRIVVLDAGFRQLGQVDEPRDVQGLTLLAYLP